MPRRSVISASFRYRSATDSSVRCVTWTRPNKVARSALVIFSLSMTPLLSTATNGGVLSLPFKRFMNFERTSAGGKRGIVVPRKMAWHGYRTPPFRIFRDTASVPSACNESTSGNCHLEKRAILPSTVASGSGNRRGIIASRRSTSHRSVSAV